MTISNVLKAEVFKQETDEAFLVLLSIIHPDIVTLRVTNNGEDIISNGNTYIPFPFSITLPRSDPQQQPRAQIEIDNVDRQIVQAIRLLTTPPEIQIQVVRASAPDTVEVQFDGFTLKDANYDALVVSGSLSVEDFLSEPYPAGIFDPSRFPGGY